MECRECIIGAPPWLACQLQRDGGQIPYLSQVHLRGPHVLCKNRSILFAFVLTPFVYPRDPVCPQLSTSPFLWPGPCATALSMPDQGPPSPTSPYRPTTPSNSRTLCVVVLRASVKLTWHLPSLARDQVLSPPPNKRPAEGVSWGYWGP